MKGVRLTGGPHDTDGLVLDWPADVPWPEFLYVGDSALVEPDTPGRIALSFQPLDGFDRYRRTNASVMSDEVAARAPLGILRGADYHWDDPDAEDDDAASG